MRPAKIKLKLFGESFKIHVLNINSDNYKPFIEASKALKQPIEEALLDVYFFKKLNLKDFQLIEDLIVDSYGGLTNTHKNKIEIWRGRRCLEKFSLNELFYSSTLFPLFNVKKDNSIIKLQDQIVLIEKEVGLISELSIEDDFLEIDQLVFHISEIIFSNENYQLLFALYYKNKKLKEIKSDTERIYIVFIVV